MTEHIPLSDDEQVALEELQRRRAEDQRIAYEAARVARSAALAPFAEAFDIPALLAAIEETAKGVTDVDTTARLFRLKTILTHDGYAILSEVAASALPMPASVGVAS